MAIKGLIAGIIKFLTTQLEEGDITADSRESLEVAIQCLESSYNVQASDAPVNLDLLSIYKAATDNMITLPTKEATAEEKAQAEKFKNDGNNSMKEDNIHEAIASYTKAIELDGRNAVYYCNRAAAYNKINNYRKAIKDCQAALAIDPSYSKAYGRMGLAYTSLDQHKEAKECYKKALEMEPDNESYKNNLQLTEEKIARLGVGSMGIGANNPAFPDMQSLLSHPALEHMARQMMSDPDMQSAMGDLISGNIDHGGRMNALLEAGRQLAEQMQHANPNLIETIRRQMGDHSNDPDPPQQN